MSGNDKRVMRHDLLTRQTQTVACYPRPEYWRVEMTIAGWRHGWPVRDVITLTPDARVRASQMHTMVVDQWRATAASLDEITDARFDLYRIAPARHREMVDDELVRVLASEVPA